METNGKLTPNESSLAVSFYDMACDYPKNTFEQIAQLVLSKFGFTKEHSQAFKAERKASKDLARSAPRWKMQF